MTMDVFEYNPGAMENQIQLNRTTSAGIDDIQQRANDAAAHIQDFWNAQGATAFHDVLEIIRQACQEGRDVVNRQADTTDNSHQESLGVDSAAGNSIHAI
ncbi:WXG100 family type VII secretion target [Mycobacteroides abscessus subsp. massiliense]|uniref:WXG100 family type VII secretion target n=1 Tax=Mycobacteroides abscessus TaxID=36809 RepID=UPI0003622DD6|nr:WXG100 family type VII secretion target [Mycobacteroides abscessus]MBN7567178.1 WXG100 family type VII secretion target [Mycobacteroides abscessus subsp. massiliense]